MKTHDPEMANIPGNLPDMDDLDADQDGVWDSDEAPNGPAGHTAYHFQNRPAHVAQTSDRVRISEIGSPLFGETGVVEAIVGQAQGRLRALVRIDRTSELVQIRPVFLEFLLSRGPGLEPKEPLNVGPWGARNKYCASFSY